MTDEKVAPKTGDVVVLCSGGPPMTVGNHEADGFRCYWFDPEGRCLSSEVFPAACLVVIPEVEEEEEAEEVSHSDFES